MVLTMALPLFVADWLPSLDNSAGFQRRSGLSLSALQGEAAIEELESEQCAIETQLNASVVV